MILCMHAAELGPGKALNALRSRPVPGRISGMRYAQTWLTAPLRKGFLPSLAINGAALITAWEDEESLDRFASHPTARLYETGWRVRLDPARSLGALRGLPDLPRQEKPSGDRPVAAITIARVRATKFPQFAVASGAAERDAARHPGLLEGFTIMRPLLWVGTFTLWRDAPAMRDYAVGSHPGGHLHAMKTDREVKFHHEMFFSRYIPYASEGQWKGRDPLAAAGPSGGVPSKTGIRTVRDGNANGRVHVMASGEATPDHDNDD